jgi:hypothetical protein
LPTRRRQFSDLFAHGFFTPQMERDKYDKRLDDNAVALLTTISLKTRTSVFKALPKRCFE